MFTFDLYREMFYFAQDLALLNRICWPDMLSILGGLVIGSV